MHGKSKNFDVKSNLYTRLGDEFLQSETNFKAKFNINKYMGQLFKKGARPERISLKLGDTPSGRMLKDLEIEEHPFQFRYAVNMSSCFDLPNAGFKSRVSFK